MESKFLKKLKVLLLLNLQVDHYCIWGSGPLAIRGLREASDVDIVVTATLWNELIKKHAPAGPKQNKIQIGEIEIWKDLFKVSTPVEQVIAEREIIEGFPFIKLCYTVEWKKKRGSQKDLIDLELIEKYLEK